MLEALGPHLSVHAGDAATVIVLGVTANLVQMNWPQGVRILAVDASPTMIRSQWRANPSVPSVVIQGSWQDLPVTDRSVSAVVGDGSLNALPDLVAYPVVLRELARLLRPDGIVVLRCFVRPEEPDRVEAIAEAAASGAFANSAPFRLRLCMALAEDDGTLVLGEFLERFDRLFPDRRSLAEAAGWDMDEIERFDMDRGSTVRLTFPTLSVLRTLCAPFFEVRAIRCGSYDLADRCPTLILSPRY